MGYIKNYMFDLAEKLGIDVDKVTDEMMTDDFADKAQRAFDDAKEPKDAEDWKELLPKKPISEVAFYDAEEGESKFKVGDVMHDGKKHWLIVE